MSQLNKETYEAFCRKSELLPVFMQDWYLDAVCGENNWDVVLVEKGGQIVAVLPFFMKKKYGFHYVAMPPLTKMMGPWVAPRWRILKHEQSIYRKLIEQLPTLDGFKQSFHYSVTNWLPFYWQGFQETTRYTYLLDLNEVGPGFDGFHRSIRTTLKKATKNLKLSYDCTPEAFFQIHQLGFDRQNVEVPFTFEEFCRHDEALAQRNARKFFVAKDEKENIHAVFYLIWDKQSAYAHLLGSDPVYGNSGAAILLLYESIRFAKDQLGLPLYDFEGSMIKNVEVIIRRFGARQQPYFYIKKYNSRLYQLLDRLRGG